MFLFRSLVRAFVLSRLMQRGRRRGYGRHGRAYGPSGFFGAAPRHARARLGLLPADPARDAGGHRARRAQPPAPRLSAPYALRVRLLAIQHPKAGGPGVFARAAREAGDVFDEWLPGLGERAPGDPAGYDAIVVMGGEQNVVDAPRLRYLQEEIVLIGEALERRQPVLGVCLGAQVLVAAAGGEVVRVSEPEIGWYEVR